MSHGRESKSTESLTKTNVIQHNSNVQVLVRSLDNGSYWFFDMSLHALFCDVGLICRFSQRLPASVSGLQRKPRRGPTTSGRGTAYLCVGALSTGLRKLSIIGTLGFVTDQSAGASMLWGRMSLFRNYLVTSHTSVKTIAFAEPMHIDI